MAYFSDSLMMLSEFQRTQILNAVLNRIGLECRAGLLTIVPGYFEYHDSGITILA